MTDQTQGTTPGAADSSLPGAGGTPPAAAGTLPVDSTPAADSPLPPSVKARLDELTAEKWAKHREAAAAEARARVAEAALASAQERLAAAGDRPPQASPPARGPESPRGSSVDQNAEIDRRARELAQNQIFNEKCQQVFNSGCAQYPDFQVKLNDLNRMVGGQLSREFVEAALATGKAHEAIYKVAADPSLADRVMTMTPLQQVVEMDRLVRGAGPPGQPVSGAPRPITPQISRGSGPVPNLEDENIPIEDWITLREKDLKDRGVNRRLT